MTKRHKPLTDPEVRAAKPGANLRDGGGLFLRVTPKGGKSWVFRYTSPSGDKVGKAREMGLGTYPAVTLSAARNVATEARSRVIQGTDPIDERNSRKTVAKEGAAERAVAPTLGEYADKDFLPPLLDGFGNAAHRQQWQATFRTHFAALRDKKLADVTKKDVLAVLKPLWADKYVTASRSRERLERLFWHAEQNHAFSGENPALMRHFNMTLIRPKEMKKGHHASIPHNEIATFITALRLRQMESMAALMLEFIALSACRTGEARFAVWSEIDLDRAVWSIPAERMKMRRPHIIPITARMLEILKEARNRRIEPAKTSDYLFPSPKRGNPLSEMACLMLMRRIKGYANYTTHGLRATFKGWAMTETEFARELIEEQLSHQLGAVEAAYVRTSAIKRRRAMMDVWESYLNGASPAEANVVPIKAAIEGGL